MYKSVYAVILISLATTAGCSETSSAVPLSTSASITKVNYQLPVEPANAVEVLDVRENAKDGEAINVIGRVGGGINPWVKGRAAFLLVDTRITPECEDEHCDANCPDCAKEMMAASTMVKFVDLQGKVLPVDAQSLLGIKDSETVVVRGVAHRDQAGNVSVEADGLYIKR